MLQVELKMLVKVQYILSRLHRHGDYSDPYQLATLSITGSTNGEVGYDFGQLRFIGPKNSCYHSSIFIFSLWNLTNVKQRNIYVSE